MSPGFWQLIIVLFIILLLFGTKKLRDIGKDLGGAIKGFREATKDKDKDKEGAKTEQPQTNAQERVIEGQVTAKEKDKV